MVAYTVGIKIFLALTQLHGLSYEAASAAVFFSCIPLTLIFAELFHVLVDMPSQWLAKHFFIWVTK